MNVFFLANHLHKKRRERLERSLGGYSGPKGGRKNLLKEKVVSLKEFKRKRKPKC